MKKITSMFMAVAMILALTIPAFATSSGAIVGTTTSGNTVEPTNPYESNFAGEYQETVIDIELPNNVALVFNPYRLEYKAATNHSSETDTAFLVDKLADQIFSAPVTIVSKSNISLKVDMTIEASKDSNSDIEFAEAVTDFDDETKFVFLQMEYGLVASANADPSTSTDKKTITLAEEELTLTGLQETEDQKAADDATKQNLWVSIPAGSAQNPQYFAYKFTGEAEDEPGTSDDPNPYRSDDKINVAMTFTFIPVANDPNQVQGGIFTYNAFASDGTTAIDAVANIGSDAGDIDVEVPEGQEGTELPSGKAWTLTKVKVDGAEIADANIANTLAFGDDAKTLTLKKATVWEKSDKGGTGVAVDKKYVKVIHVEFTATSDESTPQVVDIDCNVRVIYNPQKAAA